MIYELWDVGTANLIGAYGTEADAFAVVREAAANHGRQYPDSWALASVDDDGTTVTLARGRLLVERAMAPAVAPPGS